jgi:TfoX/Sxy family transcriptional regulator of competence genes
MNTNNYFNLIFCPANFKIGGGNRMAFDEKLADRISNLLKSQKGIVQKRMFGGMCYMLKDKMFCGIVKNDLMVRVLDEKFERMLKRPHAREMDFTGKPMKGYIYVAPEGTLTDIQLLTWLDLGIEYVEKSPPKKKRPKTGKKQI